MFKNLFESLKALIKRLFCKHENTDELKNECVDLKNRLEQQSFHYEALLEKLKKEIEELKNDLICEEVNFKFTKICLNKLKDLYFDLYKEGGDVVLSVGMLSSLSHALAIDSDGEEYQKLAERILGKSFFEEFDSLDDLNANWPSHYFVNEWVDLSLKNAHSNAGDLRDQLSQQYLEYLFSTPAGKDISKRSWSCIILGEDYFSVY